MDATTTSPLTAGAPLIGFEPCEGMAASNQARVYPIVRELQARGVDAAVVDRDSPCVVRVTLRWDQPYRAGSHRYLVLNVSDNLLHPPRQGWFRDAYFRLRTRRRIVHYLRACDAVAAGSAPQARDFSDYSVAECIPDVATYLERAEAAMRKREGTEGPVVFAWDGQGHNLPYLESLVRALPDFFRRPDVRLHVVTDRHDGRRGRDNEATVQRLEVNATFCEWDRETQIDEVGRAHVGLAPLDLGCAFAAAKPENKAIGYLSLGMPAVCSATPAYADLAHRCAAVSVCDSSAAWRAALEGLMDDRHRIAKLGQAGFAFASTHFSVAAVTDRWQRLLSRFTNP